MTGPSYAAVYTVCVSKFRLHLASWVYLSGVNEFTPYTEWNPVHRDRKKCFSGSKLILISLNACDIYLWVLSLYQS